MSVVNSAVQRMLRTATWSSPRTTRMNSAPTSGRKVMAVRIGHEDISGPP